MPNLYIITGSNGAGKSTIGKDYLPENIQKQYKIFDGDKLFVEKQKELWQAGMRAHKEAKKIAYQFVTDTFDSLVEQALTSGETFVYEGHFTNDATWDIPKRFRGAGYIVTMIFLGLTDPDLSETRVVDRVERGGHYVPRPTVEDNFFGNLEKLDKHFPLLHHLEIVDTSGSKHIPLAEFENGEVGISIPLTEMPLWFIKNLPVLTKKIMDKEQKI